VRRRYAAPRQQLSIQLDSQAGHERRTQGSHSVAARLDRRAGLLRHRPVGLGMMGFQDALYKQKISYASDDAVEFADRSMEAISYYAIKASTALAYSSLICLSQISWPATLSSTVKPELCR